MYDIKTDIIPNAPATQSIAGVEITGRGAWSQLNNGGTFYPLDPREEDIWIEDIAAHLACICRYNGAVGPRRFYTVAQHSVICSHVAEERGGLELAREALLHDGNEAYIGDMVRPLKAHNPIFVAIEDRVQAVVGRKFGIPETMTPAMKEIDNLVCACEKRDLLPLAPAWVNMPEPDPEIIINPQGPHAAYESFARRFQELFPEVEAIFDWT